MLLSSSKGFSHAPGMVFKSFVGFVGFVSIVGWGFHPNGFFGKDGNLSFINQ